MAELLFENGFHGTYCVRGQEFKIGYDAVQPYDMTYGAIASCLFSTFCTVAQERGITPAQAKINITGRRRRTTPSVLEYIRIRLLVQADADSGALRSVLEEALEKCSMVATFRQTAEIDAAMAEEEKQLYE